MLATLSIALFAVTAMIVVAVLADAFVRFCNAWSVARRELAHIDADLTFEIRQVGQAAVLRRPARHRPIATVSRLAARRVPLACAA